MTSDGAASPEDPDWVEQVLSRALERAEEDPAEALGGDAPVGVHEDQVETTPEQDAVELDPASSKVPAGVGASSSEERPVSGEMPVTPKPEPVDSGVQYRADYEETGVAGDEDGGQVNPRMRSFLEWGAVVLGALAVALLIKTFLMQAYFIPSTSMVPTLEVGDRILVNKVSYKLHDINRGDLVVFNRPPALATGEDDLIKRVIALPGETIQIEDNQVLIDGLLLTEPYLPEGMTTTTRFANVDNCKKHGPTFCTLQDDVIWVMGDNRLSSQDSRAFGPIREELVVGRAFLRVWPLGDIGAL